jgi:hypothetical protein
MSFFRLILVWNLQNCSVSTLGRFRFIAIQHLYKTIETCRDHRKISYWLVFRFIQGSHYTVFILIVKKYGS